MSEGFSDWIPAGWPALSVADCAAVLCAPGARFEMDLPRA